MGEEIRIYYGDKIIEETKPHSEIYSIENLFFFLEEIHKSFAQNNGLHYYYYFYKIDYIIIGILFLRVIR